MQFLISAAKRTQPPNPTPSIST